MYLNGVNFFNFQYLFSVENLQRFALQRLQRLQQLLLKSRTLLFGVN